MRSLLVGLGLLTLGVAAGSEPFAIKYSVSPKSFKRLAADDPLRFSVFEDAACSVLLHSEDRTAGDPTIEYTKLKGQRVKGGAKPPGEITRKLLYRGTNGVCS